MSDARAFERLPPLLRPRRADDGGGPGRRAIEAAVLVVLGLLLAAATIHDLVHQVSVDERLSVDRQTWVAYMHYKPKKIGTTPGVGSSTDVACALPFAGAGYRVCLVLNGPSGGPRRNVAGGYRLPLVGTNRYARRYDCFGVPARAGLCGASGPTS